VISRQALSNLLAILAVLSVSPLIFTFLPPNLVYLAAALALIGVNLRSVRMDHLRIIGMAIIVLAATVVALYWHDFKLPFAPLYFLVAAVALSAMPEQGQRALVARLSALLQILCIGAMLGFSYALMGGMPLFELPNLDGRTNYFYLSTFTNVVLGKVIRPSGIFDEPGTLSYFICMVAASRHMMGMSKRGTWTLLMSGLITLSLAHILYMVLHMLSERILSKRFLFWLVVLACVLVGLSFHPAVADLLNDAFFKRFVVVDGQLAGDNRSALFLNAYRHLDMASFLVGLDPTCVTDYLTCKAKFGMLGENVLGPLVQGGIFISLPYYLVLAWLLVAGCARRSNWVLIGLALLLMQRPYVMTYGYALLIMLALYSWRAGAAGPSIAPVGKTALPSS
jgi:hypothetical protein